VLKYIPFKFPDLIALWINILNPSTTSRNIRCERRHPYLIPLSGLKKEDIDPFINISKEDEII
jgi:hypothetical protein